MSEATRIEALHTALVIAEKMDLREPSRIVETAKTFDKFLSGDDNAPKSRRGRPPGKGKTSD